MLAKKNRLVREKEIKKVFKTRFRDQTKFSQILLAHNDSDFKLLIVVSKKIFKKAYKRFRIRRKISAIFEELKFKNQLPFGVTCVVRVTNKDILYMKKDEIFEDIIPKVIDLYKKISQKNFRSKPK